MYHIVGHVPEVVLVSIMLNIINNFVTFIVVSMSIYIT